MLFLPKITNSNSHDVVWPKCLNFLKSQNMKQGLKSPNEAIMCLWCRANLQPEVSVLFVDFDFISYHKKMGLRSGLILKFLCLIVCLTNMATKPRLLQCKPQRDRMQNRYEEVVSAHNREIKLFLPICIQPNREKLAFQWIYQFP